MSNAAVQQTASVPAHGAIRIVTASSLFDGHDAAINIMRRLLQSQGAEVIHLGHDRSVDEIATAAIQEDAHAVAISSYQGGHMEFFTFLVDQLAERGASHIRVYGGGGGTITPDEIETLHSAGVARIFSPEDGRSLGLEGMIASIIRECREAASPSAAPALDSLDTGAPLALARMISYLEDCDTEERSVEEVPVRELAGLRAALDERGADSRAPVVGLTGTGGAGKSSVLDELVRRFRRDSPDARIALLLVDPSRRRSGGALLGDRIRLNALDPQKVFVRSMATRRSNHALSIAVEDALRVLRAADFDLIVIETAGIGQSDSEVVDCSDTSIYVMTPEYGAPSQLEKIDMIDLADFVVLNKSDRRGALDALRDVRKQWKRNRNEHQRPDDEIPVHATQAHRWDDPGIEVFYRALRGHLADSGAEHFRDAPVTPLPQGVDAPGALPADRSRYLSDIADTVRGYHRETERLGERAGVADALARTLGELEGAEDGALRETLSQRLEGTLAVLPKELHEQLAGWEETRERYAADEQSYQVRDKTFSIRNFEQTLSNTRVPKVALPRGRDWSELTRFLRQENLPGEFPYTAGVFPFKRAGEDPTRMFAGEGTPERTNRRFHLLCRGQSAARLSTAFDSVTLYGRNPDPRPDIYGKVGNSGVSICTLDDAKKLYSGFDLCAPTTSVSLTINGPAPMILAFFLNTAIDQQVEKHLVERGELEAVRARELGEDAPSYQGELPEGHSGLGLGLLGIPGDRAVDRETYEEIRRDTLKRVRGTVQADILKEDQAQNTCIFGTEFALKMMGDIQEWFIENEVRNFYSVSISGYHMAEAGANPITQLAFTLANGFTFIEYYRERGMTVDDFAPNFSFFFSNGLDAEYNVIGRVARRIWAIALRERYGASARSQKLKYHIQTSGRSLHAQEMSFNDIRTTLQALTALQDNCNSLHTNAYDEAVTTPSEESVRRALAIQLIIQRELGTTINENPIQGSYLIDELTDLVEAAVLDEFDRLSNRGGVLGAMETLYQRSKIQEESLEYESRKHSGELPVIGVNTFENPDESSAERAVGELIRSSDGEKDTQLASLAGFQDRWSDTSQEALGQLQRVAGEGGNVFGELLEVVKVASLGEISNALFDVGGRYRRSM